MKLKTIDKYLIIVLLMLCSCTEFKKPDLIKPKTIAEQEQMKQNEFKREEKAKDSQVLRNLAYGCGVASIISMVVWCLTKLPMAGGITGGLFASTLIFLSLSKLIIAMTWIIPTILILLVIGYLCKEFSLKEYIKQKL